eukprot:gene7310-11629_t
MRLFALTLLIVFTFCLADNWRVIRRTVDVNGNNGYGSVDYSTNAKQIKGHVGCSDRCDIYLVTRAEYQKLIAGNAFQYIYGQKATTTYDFRLITDQSVIKRHLYAVAVNTNGFVIRATFTLEQDVEPASFLETILIVIVIAPIVCCCCLIFIVCGIIGALRNMILDMLGIRRYGGGYQQFGGSSSYGSSSSGGNTYSGTIGGGSSGGYSGGYGNSSSGGNTYSGSI